MNNLIKILFFWLPLILIFNGSQIVKAQDTTDVILKAHNIADICGSDDDRNVTISIGIGQITAYDSLYGFDIWLYYNPVKFQLLSGLYVNTIAEYFDSDYRGVVSPEYGVIRCYGVASGSAPVGGNKPLIAFIGKIKGNCSDTSLIKLDYIDFTDEFTKNVNDDDKSVIIEGIVKDKPDRKIILKFENDTISDFNKDSIIEVESKIYTYSNSRLENIEFELKFTKKNLFNLENVESLNDSIEIESVEENDTGYIIKSKIINNISDSTLFKFLIKTKEFIDDTSKILLTTKKISDCSCILYYENTETNIILKKDTGNINVNDTKYISKTKAYYNQNSNEFVFESVIEIEKIEIYNLYGELIYRNRLDRVFYYKLPAINYINGIYIAVIKNLNKELNKIVLIKN